MRPGPRVDQRGQRVGVRALELRELPVLEDLPGKGVAERQLLQHVDVGRVAGLGPLDRRQLQLLEEHDGELLRRVRVDRLAGELVDLPEERVELGVELLGELPEPIRVGPDPDPLQVGQDGDERHLERLVEPGEVLLLEERGLGRRQPPDAFGPRARPRRQVRRIGVVHRGSGEERLERARHGGAPRLRHQLVERVSAPARVEEIRRDRGVVDAARRERHPGAVRPADQRLRVVPDEGHARRKLRPADVVARARPGRVRRHAVKREVGRGSPSGRARSRCGPRRARGTRAIPSGRRPARSRPAGSPRGPGPAGAAS